MKAGTVIRVKGNDYVVCSVTKQINCLVLGGGALRVGAKISFMLNTKYTVERQLGIQDLGGSLPAELWSKVMDLRRKQELKDPARRRAILEAEADARVEAMAS